MPPRLVQHKAEARQFYRFLSRFYDHYVNPFFWTEPMRAQALALARLEPGHRVLDAGCGTGFTTEGVVETVPPARVTGLDQSPDQLARARAKPTLDGCTFLLGDAEALPFETDTFDRYVSAGSIEYWPDPQRGIAEAYRVLKPGGVALMIGPLRPEGRLARWVADTWMLFPEEGAYRAWFERAGFTDLRHVYVAPSWVTQERYGIALAGTKSAAGPSAISTTTPPAETADAPLGPARLARLAVGTVAGGLFIPAALWGGLKQRLRGLGVTATGGPASGDGAAPVRPDPLTPQQRRGLGAIAAGVGLMALAGWLRRRGR